MRLLKCSSSGALELVSFNDEEVPRYAILSHTWGDESEEVTFEEMGKGDGQQKPGFQKIKFCAEQAAGDGLQYFWVDSCCINKEIPGELQHAISSMFRWYQSSTKCYVFLSDIPDKTCMNREQAFQSSKWFTRGWTLQELLAPSSVEFFSADCCLLGDKRYFERTIHETTRIPKPALQGAPLSQFNVDDRLLWIDHRQTKLPEDKVYALLGIFDIQMPISYGEGWTNANSRLMEIIKKRERCIQDLRLTDPRDEKKRIEYEKGGLLKDSYSWILENSDFKYWQKEQQSRLLWVKGDPGKGKTMLLCGIIDELNQSVVKTALVSFCFCVATDARINTATAVLRRLLYMLVCQQPSLVSHIRNKYDNAGKALFEDSNAWFTLCDMFTEILEDRNLNSVYLIIDALDECIASDLPKLLELIVTKSSIAPRVKWIISSRNWPSIEKKVKAVKQGTWLCMELNENSVSAAVNSYIRSKVDQLALNNEYTDDTRDAIRDHMLSNAHGTFLWVALICARLINVPGWDAEIVCKTFPPGLEPLYKRMLDGISGSESALLCKEVLAAMSIVHRPITLDEMAVFVDISAQTSRGYNILPEIIRLCGSFLTLRESVVSFVHQSAKEFLIKRAYHTIYPTGVELVHYRLFSRSLQVMSTLKRDVYDLNAPGISIDDIKQFNPDRLSPARYSCVYWIRHLLDCDPRRNATHDLQDGGAVDEFLRRSYLYWLEALSLCRSMAEGIRSIEKLETLLRTRERAPSLSELVKDARRFIMAYQQPIQGYPLQVYTSALIFSPSSSLVKCIFKRHEPKWITIKPGVTDKWSPCLLTLEGHTSVVMSVAYSCDFMQLASASADRTVRIWDANSGECLKALKGHESTVMSITFSQDSMRLVSVSYDTVKMWDTNSGECIWTLADHFIPVLSATLSHNSVRLISVSGDHIKIWDATNRKCLQTFTSCNNVTRSVVFSHDFTKLASPADNTAIKVWDAKSGACLLTLKDHEKDVISATFSHDSTRLASASEDSTVKIWNVISGKCLRTLEVSSRPMSVAFSHNSARLASASDLGTIEIWNANSGECLQTLEGHTKSISSIVFSQDSTRLVSGSSDRTIRIWDTITGVDPQILEKHSWFISRVVISHDSTRLASSSADDTLKIWDTSSGVCLHTLEGHSSLITSIAISHDSTRLVSASSDGIIKIWEADSGDCLYTLDDHANFVVSITFSHDSMRLVSRSYDDTIKIWDANSGDCLQTLEIGYTLSDLITFSPDSTRLAASTDNIVKIWDTSSGDWLQTLEGHSGRVVSIAFSHDSTWLASGSDNTIMIWNVSTGKHLQTLRGHGRFCLLVAFSQDSKRLASASVDGTVRIWNVHSYSCLQTLKFNRQLWNLSFDITGSYLHTDVGIIALDFASTSNISSDSLEPRKPQYQDLILGLHGDWITCNSEKLVWLPSEYRPSLSTVSKDTIGVGVDSGKVWMCNRQITDLR